MNPVDSSKVSSPFEQIDALLLLLVMDSVVVVDVATCCWPAELALLWLLVSSGLADGLYSWKPLWKPSWGELEPCLMKPAAVASRTVANMDRMPAFLGQYRPLLSVVVRLGLPRSPLISSAASLATELFILPFWGAKSP